MTGLTPATAPTSSSGPAPAAAAGAASEWTPDQTRALMEAYLGALLARGNYDHFFSDGVVFSLEGNGQRAEGRLAVRRAIDFLHAEAFDGRPEVKTLIAGRDKAALEADFVGTHTAEFAGIPAGGRSVRVPYSVFYDVAGGKITALRIYLEMNALIGQLSA
jgi:predicted ester cyclase